MRAIARLGVLLGMGTLTATSPARAQVDAERIRATARQPGTHLGIDTSVTWTRGNVNYLAANMGLNLGYNGGGDDGLAHQALLFGTASYAEISDDAYLSRALGHARWTARLGATEVARRFASELFAQVQYDAFLKLRFRAVGGGGVRTTFVDTEAVHMYAGTGYMFEREEFQDELLPEDPHPRTTTNHRWTSYLTLSVALDESFTLTNTVYVQPRFDDFPDFRVLETFSLTLKSSTVFAITAGLSMRYDSDPPSVVAGLDTEIFTKLQVLLHRPPPSTTETDEEH